MQNMLSSNSGHSLVAVQNMPFAVEGNGKNCCEVLNDVFSKFVGVKSSISCSKVKADAVSDNFFVFRTNWSSLVYKYVF